MTSYEEKRHFTKNVLKNPEKNILFGKEGTILSSLEFLKKALNYMKLN